MKWYHKKACAVWKREKQNEVLSKKSKNGILKWHYKMAKPKNVNGIIKWDHKKAKPA